MYFVLIGGDNLSFFLAKLLLDEEHEVVVIEKNKEVAEKISDELDIVTIIDDATKQHILEDAGVSNADAVISLTDADEVNLVVGMLAKQIGAKKVAIKLSRTNYQQDFLKKIGIDVVFNPDAAAANYIEELLTKPDVLDLAYLSRGDAEIIEEYVDEKMIGKKIKDLNNKDFAIIAIFDDKEMILPEVNTQLKKGQKILILAKTPKARKLHKK